MTPHRYDNGEAYARIRKAVQAHGLRHTTEASTIEGVSVRNEYSNPSTGAQPSWWVAGVRLEACGDISHVVEAIIAARAAATP